MSIGEEQKLEQILCEFLSATQMRDVVIIYLNITLNSVFCGKFSQMSDRVCLTQWICFCY